MISEAKGQKDTAGKYYSLVGTWNPYFEEGIIAAADFFRKEKQDDMKPYNILVEAIQVNNNSYRLLKAYAEEAERRGFDEYAASARKRMADIHASAR